MIKAQKSGLWTGENVLQTFSEEVSGFKGKNQTLPAQDGDWSIKKRFITAVFILIILKL